MAWRDAVMTLFNKTLISATFDKTQSVVVDYAADGALDPARDNATLSKGSAGAYTLAAPSLAQNGHLLTITSRSAFAHVVTATGLVEDGVTGGAKGTLTFAAFKGASITLQALDGHWSVLGKNVVTIT